MTSPLTVFRRYPKTAFCFVCMELLLCGLGIWQIKRLGWKNDLQNRIDHILAQTVLPNLNAQDFSSQTDKPLIRGKAKLTLLPSKAIYLNGYIKEGKTAWPVIVPAKLEGTVLHIAVVAWVADQKYPQQDWRNRTDITGNFSGIIRRPETSVFKPHNNPRQNDWWQIDTAAMAESWDVSPIAPTVFYAEDIPAPSAHLHPYLFPSRLRNEHLQYAIFWFSMAGLLGLFGLWTIQRQQYSPAKQ